MYALKAGLLNSWLYQQIFSGCVSIRWETCVLSKSFSHVSNIPPDSYQCNWEETQAFVFLGFQYFSVHQVFSPGALDWSLYVYWVDRFQKVETRIELTWLIMQANSWKKWTIRKSSGCSGLLKWFRRNFNFWMQKPTLPFVQMMLYFVSWMLDLSSSWDQTHVLNQGGSCRRDDATLNFLDLWLAASIWMLRLSLTMLLLL